MIYIIEQDAAQSMLNAIWKMNSYSAFNVIDGSILAARHAGTQHAITDTPISSTISVTKLYSR